MTSGYDNLYGGSPPFVSGSDTSEVAAVSITDRALVIREQVFDHIRRAGGQGSTCCEIERTLGLSHQTASARIRELVLKGRACDSGYRRKTTRNRPAVVWVKADLPGYTFGPNKSTRERLREAEGRIKDLEHEIVVLYEYMSDWNRMDWCVQQTRARLKEIIDGF